LYRVEVHSTGATGSFKWSRDNASMSSKVRTTDQNASLIVVEDAGRDDVIGFASAKYVELSNETLALNGQPGTLLEVDSVTGTSIRIKNPSNVSLAPGANPILRRWDGIGGLKAATPLELEDGVQIEFDSGTFAAGDYWLIPARTLTGRVEWPRDGSGNSTFEARHGTRHHYAALAVVSFSGGTFAADVVDCRNLFPPLTAIKASDVSYAPGACATLQGAHTVQEALKAKGLAIESAELTMVPKNTVKVEGADAERILKLMEVLEELDDVSRVSSNFDIDAAQLAEAEA
jgi:hypothetical protein